ncbi:MAG: ABC transporter substrate-binding protein, partial [Deltaproteobacteria bacterium]|nr:ABC transporter substrate-binding protein [Deltaproteobacteria bacterium]
MSLENKTLEYLNRFRKSMFRYAIILTFALTTSAAITATSFAACGSLTMAEMNWASAE